MPNKRGKRASFGSIRQLPSGRWQARYSAPDGLTYTAPVTFPTRSDAQAFLATAQADIVRNVWKSPTSHDAPREHVAVYGERWLREHASLKPSTRKTYTSDFTLHIKPHLGDVRIDQLTTQMIRSWRADLVEKVAAANAAKTFKGNATKQDGRSTAARAYRLLRAMLNTAVEDDLIPFNPCRIRKGGSYESPERPTLTPREVEELCNVVPKHYRVLTLVAAYSGLRIGEVCELRRSDIDLEQGLIRVRRGVYHANGQTIVSTTKSGAGVRDVPIPAFLQEELSKHLRLSASIDPRALVFTTSTGRQANLSAPAAIRKGMARIGRPDVTTHDLRHTAGTLLTQNGANLREVMRFLGHSTSDAAMRYQHASPSRLRQIAAQIDAVRQDLVG